MSKYPWLHAAPSETEKIAVTPPVKPKVKAKTKPRPKTKPKKEPPSSLPEIDISGCRYSDKVLRDVIKAHGLRVKDKKAVLGAALSQDEDLNRYLNKDELNAGAAIVAAQGD